MGRPEEKSHLDRSVFETDAEAALLRGGFDSLLKTFEVHARRNLAGDDIVYLLNGLANYLEKAAGQTDNLLQRGHYFLRSGEIQSGLLGKHSLALPLFQKAFIAAPTYGLARRVYTLLVGRVSDAALLAVVRAQVATATNDDEYVSSLLVIARIERKGGNEFGARKALEQVLERVEGHPEATRTLSRLDEKEERKGVLPTIEDRLKGVASPRERASILCREADRVCGANPAEAESLYRRSMKELVTSENTQRLAAIVESQGEGEALIALHESVIEEATEKDLILHSHRALGKLLSGAEAIEHLRVVHEAEPRTTSVLMRLAELYREAESWNELVGILKILRQATGSIAEGRGYEAELAQVLWHQLEDLDGAEPYFRRWRAVDPDADEVRTFFLELAREREDWVSLVRAMKRTLKEAPSRDRPALLREIASLTREKLGSPEGALDSFRQLLREDPTERAAFTEIEGILESGNRWTQLTQFYQDEATLAQERGEGDRERELLEKLREVTSRSGRFPVQSLYMKAVERLQSLSTLNVDELRGLAKEYAEKGEERRSLAILEDLLPLLAEDERQNLHLEMGGRYQLVEGSRLEAIPHLEAYMEASEGPNPPQLTTLRELYRLKRDAGALKKSFEEELTELKGEKRAAVLRELAYLLEDEFSDVAGATRVFLELHEAGLTTAPEVQHLRKLLEESGMWEELTDLLVEEGQNSPSKSQRVAAYERAGEVFLDELMDGASARMMYVKLLEVSPFHTVARARLRELQGDDEDWSELRLLYGSRGDWRGYLRLLVEAEKVESTPAKKADIHQEIAEVLDQELEESETALRHYESVLGLDPGRIAIARLLMARYPEDVAPERKAAALELVALYGNEPGEASRAMGALCALYEAEKDWTKALEWAGRALELSAAEGSLASADTLLRLAELAHDFDTAADGLEESLRRFSGDPAERGPVLLSLGLLLWRRLQRGGDAREVFEEFLAQGTPSMVALDCLQEIATVEGDWAALEGVLIQRAEGAESEDQRVASLEQLGEMYESIFDDSERAIAVFGEALSLVPNTELALEGSTRLLEEREEWESLHELLVNAAGAAEKAAGGRRWFQVAEIRHRRLDRLEDAVEAYATSLELEPEHGGARAALEGIVRKEGQNPSALEILERVYRAKEEWDALASLLERKALYSEDRDIRLAIRKEVCDLLMTELNTPEMALPIVRKMVMDVPEDFSLIDLWMSAAGGSDSELRVIRKSLQKTGLDLQAPESAECALRLASVEEALGEREAARKSLDGIQETAANAEVLLERKAALDISLGNVEGAGEHLSRLVDVVTGAERQVSILQELSGLFRGVDPNGVREREALRRALDLEGLEGTSGSLMRDSFERDGDWAGVVAWDSERVSSGVLDQNSTLSALETMGSNAWFRLEDGENSGRCFRRWLQEAEGQPIPEVLEELVLSYPWETPDLIPEEIDDLALEAIEYAAETRDWEREILFRERRLGRLDTHQGAEELLALANRASGDLCAAEQAYGFSCRAIEAGEQSPESIQLATQLATEMGVLEGLVSFLEERIDAGPPISESLVRRAASLSVDVNGDYLAAADHYRTLLTLECDETEVLALLDTCLTEAGEDVERLTVIARRAELATDQEQSHLYQALGALARLQGETVLAIASFEEVRTHVSSSPQASHQALLHLTELYEHSNRPKNRVDTLVARAAHTEETTNRADLLMQAGRIAEDELNDRVRGAALFEEILERTPGLNGPWLELERSYTLGENWEGLEGLYTRKLELLERGDEWQRTLRRLSEIYVGPLEKPDDAFNCFEELLSYDPQDLDVREGLRLIQGADGQHAERAFDLIKANYERWDETEEWVSLLQEALGMSSLTARRRDLQLELAECLDAQLERPDEAWGHLMQAWEDNLEDTHVWGELVRVTESIQGWSGLQGLVESALDGSDSSEVRAVVAERAARVFGQDANQPALAAQLLERVREDAPEKKHILEELERLYEECEDWSGLASVLREQAEDASSPGKKASYRFLLATVCANRLEDVDTALAECREIFVDFPLHEDARLLCEKALLKNSEPSDSVVFLEEWLEALGEEGTTQPWCEKYLVALQHEGSQADKISLQAISLLAFERLSSLGVGALEGLRSRGECFDRVAPALLPVYEESGRWDDVAALLEEWSIFETDATQTKIHLEQAYHVATRKLSDSGRALSIALRLLPLDPEGGWRSLGEEHAAETGAWGPWLEGLLEIAGTQEGQESQALLLHIVSQAGKIQEESLVLEKALRGLYSSDPASKQYTEMLEEWLRDAEHWQDLLQLMEECAERAGDSSSKSAFYLEAAEIALLELGDTRQGAEYLQRILVLEPKHDEAIERLEGALTSLEDWERLAGHYRHWIGVTSDGATRVDIRLRRGGLCTNVLEWFGDAAQEGILAIEEGGRNCGAFEFLLELLHVLDPRETLPDGRGARRQVALSLRQHLSAKDPWETVVLLEEILLEGAESLQEEAQRLIRVGRLLWTEAQDSTRGYSRFCAALYREFNEDVLDETQECAQAADMLVEFRDLLAELAERHESEREGLLLRAATFSRNVLSDGVSANAFYEQILATNPSSEEALDALESYHRSQGRPEGVRDVLRKRLAQNPSLDVQGALWAQIGELEEEAGQVQGAIAAYDEAWSRRPDDASLLVALERLFRKVEDWSSLESNVRAQIALTSDTDVEFRLKMELGRLITEDRPEEAIQVFRDAQDLMPGSRDPAQELRALYRREERWAALVALLEKERTTVEGLSDRGALAYEIGHVLEGKLGAVDQALLHYRLALDDDPNSSDAMLALESLLEDESHQLEASLILESRYEHLGRYEGLVRVMEIQASHAVEGVERALIVERHAGILERELLAPGKAVELRADLLRRGVAFSEIEQGITNAAVEFSLWPETLTALALAAEEMQIGGSDVVKWCALAWEERLGDAGEGAATLERCLALNPADKEAFGRLGTLYERLGKWAELADLLERDLDMGPRDRSSQSRLRLGMVLRDGLQDAEGAFGVFRQLLLDHPESVECEEEIELLALEFQSVRGRIVELLKPIYGARGDREGQMRLLDLLSRSGGDGESRAQALWEAAELAIDEFGDQEGGFGRFSEALALYPAPNADGMDRFIELGKDLGKLEEVVSTLESLQGGALEPVKRIEIQARLGRLYVEKGDSAAAELVLRQVLELDESHPYTLRALHALYARDNRHLELRDICVAELSGPVALERRGMLLKAIANASMGLGDGKAAVEAYEQLLGLDMAGCEELEKLALLYEGIGMMEFLLLTLERLALLPELSNDRAVEVKLRLAGLEENTFDGTERAIRWYEDVLEVEPGHWESLTALERIYRSKEEWGGLVHVLGMLADVTEARVRKIALWKERADLCEFKLDDPEAAEESLHMALEIEPGSVDVVDELVRIYHKTESWKKLANLYEAKLERMAKGSEWKELALKAVEVYLERLDAPKRADSLLSELAAGGAVDAPVLLAYGRLKLRMGETEQGEELLNRSLGEAKSSKDEVDALVELGRLHIDQGKDYREALEFLLRAVDLSPYHPGVNTLLRDVYRRRERWDALIGVLRRQLKGLEPGVDAADKCMEIARTYLQELNKPEEALPYLEQAYSWEPGNEEALRLLVDELSRQNDMARLLPLIREWVGTMRSRRDFKGIAPYAFLMGKAEEAHGSVEAAEGAYRLAYRQDPSHVETLIRLATLLLSQGGGDEALPILQALQLRQHGLLPSQKVFVFHALAMEWAGRGETRKGIQFLERALRVDPGHEASATLLKELRGN